MVDVHDFFPALNTPFSPRDIQLTLFFIIYDYRRIFNKIEHCMTTLQLSIIIFNYHRKVPVVIKMLNLTRS